MNETSPLLGLNGQSLEENSTILGPDGKPAVQKKPTLIIPKSPGIIRPTPQKFIMPKAADKAALIIDIKKD